MQAMKDGQEYARWKGKEIYKPEFILIHDASYIRGLKPCLICNPPDYIKK
jgi:hypothetical protein